MTNETRINLTDLIGDTSYRLGGVAMGIPYFDDRKII
jgi:hypothetical protein